MKCWSVTTGSRIVTTIACDLEDKHSLTAIFLVLKHWHNFSFDIQICQPWKKRSHCFSSQWDSGWHINNNGRGHEKHCYQIGNYVIAFFHFVYKYNLYCHKVQTSFLISHLWHVYIFCIITTKEDHLILPVGGGGGGLINEFWALGKRNSGY